MFESVALVRGYDFLKEGYLNSLVCVMTVHVGNANLVIANMGSLGTVHVSFL